MKTQSMRTMTHITQLEIVIATIKQINGWYATGFVANRENESALQMNTAMLLPAPRHWP